MMKKERLAAFTDALLAIVMTILVLELDKPPTLDWAGLWSIRHSFYSYALSFFWLGAMWVRLHNEWDEVENVSREMVWWSLLLLFLSSLVPYTTSIVDDHFHSEFAQAMYGVVVVLLTLANRALTAAMHRANPRVRDLTVQDTWRRNWLRWDITIKCLGILLAITVYPPAMMFAILLTFLPLVLNFLSTRRRIS